jgi:hypothetical protein
MYFAPPNHLRAVSLHEGVAFEELRRNMCVALALALVDVIVAATALIFWFLFSFCF